MNLLVTRLCLVTHCLRGSASQEAGKAVRSQAEPGNATYHRSCFGSDCIVSSGVRQYNCRTNCRFRGQLVKGLGG